jgi:hypothetical protein
MTKQMFPRRLLDDAIDRAVQDLVQADPRPGLRRRVLAQLEAPPKRVWWAPRLLVPAGAIAVLAVWFMPASEPVAPPPQVVAQRPVPSPPGPAAQPPAIEQAPPSVAAPRPSARRAPEPSVAFSFGPPTDRVAATSVADSLGPGGAPAPGVDQRSHDVPPGLPPLEIEPIEIAPIELQPIVVKPIGTIRSSL